MLLEKENPVFEPSIYLDRVTPEVPLIIILFLLYTMRFLGLNGTGVFADVLFCIIQTKLFLAIYIKHTLSSSSTMAVFSINVSK